SFILAISFASFACDRSASHVQTEAPSVASGPASTDDESPKKERAGDLEVLELTTAGAHAKDILPMIVAIHGLGDKPENWLDFFSSFPVPARIILPRAPEPWGEGGSWFGYPPKSIDDLAQGVALAGDRVAKAIADLEKSRPTKGRAIVTGFSQGGFVSYDLAVHHADVISAAFPMSGALPSPLAPANEAEAKAAAPIFAVHGDADRIVPIQMDRDGVAKIASLGGRATLQEFPRIQHTVTPAMKRAITDRIEAVARGDADAW
ncbi:MAG: alpha/beta hydrolase, partial [Polyangiaceae bacterium]